jgi:2-keto-4-pentenoate hydratase
MSAVSVTVAEQLRRAYAEGPIAPVRATLASPTADLAYEIQEINTRHWSAAGRRIVKR